MKVKFAWAVVAICLTAGFVETSVCGQEPAVIPLASEPHHHLALHNEYVNV